MQQLCQAQLGLAQQLTFIFSPGTGCYFPQLTKYCESVSFRSPLNSNKVVKLQHPRACPVIGSDHYCVQYPEIDVQTPFMSPLHYMLTRHLSLWQGKYNPHPLYCNFVRMRNFNFSQQLDVAALDQQFQQYLLDNGVTLEVATTPASNGNNTHLFDNLVNVNNVVVNHSVINSSKVEKKKPLVLFGSSRGASTIITWCSIMKEHAKHLDAIVLEGCPSSISDIYEFDSTWVNYWCKLLLSNVTTYDSHGITVNLVCRFTPQYPYLLCGLNQG